MTHLTLPFSKAEIAKTFDLPGIAFCAASAPTSRELFFGCSNFKVYRIDTSSEKPAATPLSAEQHNSYVSGVVYNGDHLITGGYDGDIIWWDSATGEVKSRRQDAHSRWIRQLATSPDGRFLASVGDDMMTRIWDPTTTDLISEWSGHEEQTPNGYPSMLFTSAFSADGNFLATGDKTGKVLIRDVPTGKVAGSVECPVMYTWDPKARRHSIGGIRSLAFSADGSRIAVGGMGTVGNIDHLGGKARIEIFEWRSGERLHEIESDKFKGLVERLEFGPDDSCLMAAGGDHGGFLTLYDTSSGEVLAELKAPMHVHDFEFNPGEAQLLAVGHNKGCVIQLS